MSGGPDSLALCLLADCWARARAGEVLALTVDHGLRPESARETHQVQAWLAARGIAHEILTWRGPKPTTGIQAAARAARYDLLGDWCRRHGVLHLLLAHHQDDQAETFALRRARGSGPDGLAGMAAVRELENLRLLRPLLSVPKARLMATLRAEGQPWIEDPSNRDPAFARTRLRLADQPEPGQLAAQAAEFGWRRAELDRRIAAWLVQSATVDPAGFLVLSRSALQEAELEIARRALTQALGAIGARPYAPRAVRLQALLDALRGPQPLPGRTLAGCRVIAPGERLLICREPAAVREVLALRPDVPLWWDGRFAVRWHGRERGLVLRAFGQDGWRQRDRLRTLDGARALPAAVRPSLPSVWRGQEVLFVPALGLVEPAFAGHVDLRVSFRPRHPLTGPRFATPEPAAGVVMPGFLGSIESLC